MMKNPPIAPVKPHDLTIHGHTRIDNYYWLREKENPEVITYLEAENEYTQAMMAPTQALQEELYREMVGRIQETDSSVPVRHGDYFYYTRTEAGKQYAIHCRKQGSLDAPEDIILDENDLAEGQPYFKLGIREISPDHTILAYSTDTAGSERYTIFFKELATGKLLPDQIPQTNAEAEWANDNRTLFYTVPNEEWRPYQLRRHTLRDDPAQDPIIYQEDDALFLVSIGKSKDEAYLFLSVAGIESSEAYFLDAHDPAGNFTLLQPRQERIRYSADHRQGQFYILTNEDAPNRKLLVTPVAAPQKENWQEFIPHDPERYLEAVELFADYMAVYGRTHGLRALQIHNFTTNQTREISFPEPVYSYKRAENPESNARQLRLVYQSLTTADTTYDIDMETLEWTFRKRESVLGGYDPDDYVTERHLATAADGTQVPISLVYKKGVVRDGRAPCLLYGYGSYGANMEPRFDAKRLSLLDRGFIYAIAHVRGGQEMGRVWYDQGKWLHKRNTFTDFIACAEHLIAEKLPARTDWR
jgi:oligopeptidase B